MIKGPFDDGVLAQAWCSPENEHKEMDVVLLATLTRIANARYHELHPPASEEMRFTAKDFESLNNLPKSFPLSWDTVAEQCNAKLQRIFAQGVRVYSADQDLEGAWVESPTDLYPYAPTYSGVVVNIEKMEGGAHMDISLLATLTRIANARYREILEKEGVRVWGSVSDETGMELFGCWDEKQTRKNYSHTGIVVAIEEIKRAECDRLLKENHEKQNKEK